MECPWGCAPFLTHMSVTCEDLTASDPTWPRKHFGILFFCINFMVSRGWGRMRQSLGLFLLLRPRCWNPERHRCMHCSLAELLLPQPRFFPSMNASKSIDWLSSTLTNKLLGTTFPLALHSSEFIYCHPAPLCGIWSWSLDEVTRKSPGRTWVLMKIAVSQWIRERTVAVCSLVDDKDMPRSDPEEVSSCEITSGTHPNSIVRPAASTTPQTFYWLEHWLLSWFLSIKCDSFLLIGSKSLLVLWPVDLLLSLLYQRSLLVFVFIMSWKEIS